MAIQRSFLECRRTRGGNVRIYRSGCHTVCFHHPAAPHRLVNVHQRLEENPLCLGLGEFGDEEAPFCVEYLDITRISVFKSQTGNAGIVAE